MDTRRASALFAPIMIMLMMSLTVTLPSIVRAEDFDKTNQASSGTLTIGNNVLDVHVEDISQTLGVGTYSITAGSAHPNPGHNVFYNNPEGSANPWSSYNTIHVVDTQHDYITSRYNSEYGSQWISPDPGYTLVELDSLNPSTTSTPTKVTNTWTTLENLNVVQESEVIGTTLADTLVRVTMKITNDDAVAHTVGLRYEWDLMINGMDGAWFRPWTDCNTPETWLDTETEWVSPAFQFWETSNIPVSLFSVYGSVSSPPSSTPPDRLVYAYWLSAWGQAYSYTPTGIVIGAPDPPDPSIYYDSTVLYYWNPTTINPGESKDVTAYVTTFITAISTLSATVDIDPDRLNLQSNGEWVMAYVTLPERYLVEDIDVTTVEISYDDFVSAAEWGDIQDGVLMVKFDRIALRDYLGAVDLCDGDKFYDITLTVTGELLDGTPFEGFDTIVVIKR